MKYEAFHLIKNEKIVIDNDESLDSLIDRIKTACLDGHIHISDANMQ